MKNLKQLGKMIAAGRGDEPADLVIRHAKIFHLTTGEFETADIACSCGKIVGIGQGYAGKEVFDAAGKIAVPGFVDTHVHVESSNLLPHEFEKCILPHGTTTIFCDPHELANVVGPCAFDFFRKCASSMVLDMFTGLSSCVPATSFETSGAEIPAETLIQYKEKYPESRLAEFMNVPGVLFREPEVLKKIAAFERIDGHAPLLSGKDLCAYLAAGIGNCHESSTIEEINEKLKRGMNVLIREGTAARNLEAAIPAITVQNSPFLAFCTDDRGPLEIAGAGHIDGMIAKAIRLGADPLAVYRAASWSAARIMGKPDRGLIAPGYLADVVLLNDLKTCDVAEVFKSGRRIVPEIYTEESKRPNLTGLKHTVHRDPVTADSFVVRDTSAETHVIGILPYSLITEHLKMDLPVQNGVKNAVPEKDILKISVLERHGKNGNISTAFVHGFGGIHGAAASTIGHDSHNICVIGSTDSAMAEAVNTLIKEQGGYAVVSEENKLLACLPLPIGGLMSDMPLNIVKYRLKMIFEALSHIGFSNSAALLQMEFLTLPVIPHLKLTDCGLFDYDSFSLL